MHGVVVPSWVYAIAAIVCLCAYRLRNVGRRPADYPPGPPTLPIIGNLHLMPKKDPHVQFQKWAEEYGPVFSLILGTNVMIVLSSGQAVRDLLDKRSSIYSSRPDLYLGGILSGNLRMLLMPYGETWRMIRKVYHASLNIKIATGYVPYQDLECMQMLNDFLDQPNLFLDHIRRLTNSLTAQMVFGFRAISINDPKLKELYEEVDVFSRVMGSDSGALLEVFPLLRHLPDAFLPMRKYAQREHQTQKDLFVGHWMNAKANIKNGTAKPSFSVELAKAQEVEGISDAQAAYLCGTLLEAGSDTTASTLIGFVQAMLLYPDVQRKAQEELDRVCGDSRLPTMDDEADLPYIRACVKESLRWMPTAILGVPHAVIREDEYMGYMIPKGANVMLNVWAIHMDPNRYANPSAFDPSRYHGELLSQTASEAAANPDHTNRDHYGFGAGRRICQGMHIAERSLFLAISRMLWAYNFEKATDGKGRDVTPDPEALTQGFVVAPEPFAAKIIVRSEKHAQVLRKAWEDSQEFLDQEKQWSKVPKGMASVA